MSYVILQPRSNTNPTNAYKVVASEDWTAFANKAKQSLPEAGSFKKYSDAEALRDELNGESK